MIADHHQLVRLIFTVLAYPVMAIILFGVARITAKCVVRFMPDCALKRRLFTDVDTRLLAYKPGVRGNRPLEGRSLSSRDAGEDGP